MLSSKVREEYALALSTYGVVHVDTMADRTQIGAKLD